MALDDAEFALLQTRIDELMERMAALRLSLIVETDFAKLVDFLHAIRAPWINPTFDPACSDLGRDAFWIRIVDEKGNTIGSHAQKVFVAADFCALIDSGILWYPGKVELKPGQLPWRLRQISTHIAGNIAYAGSLWIDPRYRKRGLSLFVPFLSRALCFRNYDIDFYTCLVLRAMAESAIPKNAYGYLHVEPVFDGWFPPARSNEQEVHICYLSQRETIEQFRRLPAHSMFATPGAEPDLQRLTA
jgi:hypothetical protein